MTYSVSFEYNGVSVRLKSNNLDTLKAIVAKSGGECAAYSERNPRFGRDAIGGKDEWMPIHG